MIAEDHTIMRSTLVSELNTETIEVIGDAANGRILLDLVEKNEPDIVLLDLDMPVMGGREVLNVFSEQFPEIRCVIFSYDDALYSIAEMIMKGACAYLTKNQNIDGIVAAIESVYLEGYYFNEHLSQQILNELRDSKKLFIKIGEQKFSEREIEIIKLLGAEITAEKIADHLNITTSGVYAAKKRIFKKAESNTIVSLIKYAIKHGIVNPERNKLRK